MQEVTAKEDILDRELHGGVSPHDTPVSMAGKGSQRGRRPREVGQVTAGPGCALSKPVATWEPGAVRQPQTHRDIRPSCPQGAAHLQITATRFIKPLPVLWASKWCTAVNQLQSREETDTKGEKCHPLFNKCVQGKALAGNGQSPWSKTACQPCQGDKGTKRVSAEITSNAFNKPEDSFLSFSADSRPWRNATAIYRKNS